MGGKRPDQYAIDPAEAGAASSADRQDDKQRAADQQKYAESRADVTRESFIPQGAENPALADLKARREQASESEADAGAE